MNFIYDLHHTMMSRNLILAYHGDFSQETTKSILAMAERSLQASEEDSTVKKKVFNVMVESLQNIVKHSAELPGHTHTQPAIFLVGKEANGYSVMSGNAVPRGTIAGLKATLDKINALDKEGLRELYKTILKGTTLSEKGGAGLGLVDMARKSGEKLSFDFQEMSESYCFFCLKVNVSLEA